jgi:rod shape-determining protein MreC
MESVLGRYRNLVILVGVLFLQLLGLGMQVKRGSDSADTRLIRIWAVEAITPLERALVDVQNGARSLWHNYFYLRGVRAENRQLKDQLEQLRIEQVRLSEDAAQARRLQALLDFKEQYISKTVAAQVIGSSGSDLSRSVYIDKGSDAGVKSDMPVITADGIVGKVLRVYPSTSLVLLINDQSSGVGAILEKTRLQGVLKGTATGELTLERIMSDEQVPPGETILTSGGDQIFPKGLPVGTVAKVGNGKDLFLNIKVKPTANLSKLEEVLVVLEKQERRAATDVSVRARAADILAQRLPSVPDKPAVDPKLAAVPSATPGNTAATGPKAASNPLMQSQTGLASHSAGGKAAPASAMKKTAPKIELVNDLPAHGNASPAVGSKPATPKAKTPAPSNSVPAQTTPAPPVPEDTPQ